MPSSTPHSASPRFSDWLIATRPWSFTAATIPITVGTSLAAMDGHWHVGLFTLTLMGGILLQAATNLYNTYGDYISGVDTLASAVTCPQLVDESFRPEAIRRTGLLLFSLAGLLGIFTAWFCGPLILLFTALGTVGGYSYTNGKKPFKYRGLGPCFVFLLMGPLMVLPAYYIQAGRLTAAPLAVSISISCLVTAIMHANDMRDVTHDQAAGIRTVAIALGRKKSLGLFVLLTIGAFVVLGVNLLSGLLPMTCLGAFLTLPMLSAKLLQMRRPEYDCSELESWTAKLHFQFGALLAVGPLLQIALSAMRG